MSVREKMKEIDWMALHGINMPLAITGEESTQKRKDLDKLYIPNKIILGGKQGTLPLLQDKFVGEDKIFVCKDKTCMLPVSEVSEAIKQIFE